MLKLLKTLFLAAVVTMSLVFVGCNKDDEAKQTVSSVVAGKYQTKMESYVKVMNMTADSGEGEVCIVATGDSVVDVYLPATKTVVNAMMGDREISMTYDIGEMIVKDVKLSSAQLDGGKQIIAFEQPSFDAQAGAYSIQGGKLEGAYAEGVLTISATYRPGSMPFDLKTTFSSKAK